MYTHIFNFSFAEATSQATRMRFLAELFEEPEPNGDRPLQVYWCTVSYKGAVEFYSGMPETTGLLKRRLIDAQSRGLITLSEPGLKSATTFHGRILSALIIGAFKSLRRGDKGTHP